MLPFLIGYTNWVSNIKNDLYKNGFGYVWETKMYETKRFFFLKSFEQRMKGSVHTKVENSVRESIKLSLYCQIKNN